MRDFLKKKNLLFVHQFWALFYWILVGTDFMTQCECCAMQIYILLALQTPSRQNKTVHLHNLKERQRRLLTNAFTDFLHLTLGRMKRGSLVQKMRKWGARIMPNWKVNWPLNRNCGLAAHQWLRAQQQSLHAALMKAEEVTITTQRNVAAWKVRC